MRESRTLGSVRAKAEWLSYSTIPRENCLGLNAPFKPLYDKERLTQVHCEHAPGMVSSLASDTSSTTGTRYSPRQYVGC